MWKQFNPTLKKMQEENPDITIMGIYWAGLWRLYVLIFFIAIAFGVFAVMFNA
jgi:hypothetical protein